MRKPNVEQPDIEAERAAFWAEINRLRAIGRDDDRVDFLLGPERHADLGADAPRETS